MKLFSTTILAVMLLTSVAHASELRGTLEMEGAVRLHVSCSDGFYQARDVPENGSYSIRGLPSNKSCNFVVTQGQAKSVKMPFNTNDPVESYSATLRFFKDVIVVINKS